MGRKLKASRESFEIGREAANEHSLSQTGHQGTGSFDGCRKQATESGRTRGVTNSRRGGQGRVKDELSQKRVSPK